MKLTYKILADMWGTHYTTFYNVYVKPSKAGNVKKAKQLDIIKLGILCKLHNIDEVKLNKLIKLNSILEDS